MDPIELPAPDAYDALDADAVAALSRHIRDELRHLRDAGSYTSDVLARMRDLRDGYEACNARAAALEDARTAAEAEAAELTADLDDAPEAPDGEPGDDVEHLTVELAEPGDEPGVVEAGDDSQFAVEVGETDGEPVEGTQLAAAPTRLPLSSRNALSALNRRQRRAVGAASAPANRPTPGPARNGHGTIVAAADLNRGRGELVRAGTPFDDNRQFAEVVTDIRHRLGRMSLSGRSFEYVGHTDLFPGLDERNRLAEADPVLNYGLLQDASDPTKINQALVASGSICPPDNPMYSFFRLAVPQSPVEAALPVVPAPRGGIRYITTPDFRDAREAIGTRTVDENADPDAPDKPCARATCPDVSEAYVTAVSECVRWDNLSYRAFPELVENFMTDVSVNQASVKECLYLSAIDDASTRTTATTPSYGAMRALAYHLRLAASGYRKRQNMPRDAVLQWAAPNWLPDLLLADMVNDHALGMDMLTRGSISVLGQILTNLGLAPVWYNDQAHCTDGSWLDYQAWRGAQGATALNPWPVHAVSYLFAPGEFVRIDAGTLDVGLVRDSSLNGTNDLELFMEQWVGVVDLGLESIRIDHTLCPNGTAPAAVDEMSCAGPS